MAASDFFLQRQLDALMAKAVNQDDQLWVKTDQHPVKRLEQLARHYNGHIRQRAVLRLGYMHQSSSLPALIERANDWAAPVRTAARQSIRRYITLQDAVVLVNCLPDFYRLLNGERDDHQRLVDEVIQFLSLPQNRPRLLDGVCIADKNIARIATQVLIEQQLFPPEIIFQQVSQQQDCMVRLMAAKAVLSHCAAVTTGRMQELLRDSYPPIKQLALHYVINQKAEVSLPLLHLLLLDRNELVRKRAARLLDAGGLSPTEYYLSVFNDSSRRVAERSLALLGLDEQKYPPVEELALKSLDSQQPGMYRAALRVIVWHQQQEAREILLEAISCPSPVIGRMACRQFIKLKLFLLPGELQPVLDTHPSADRQRLCLALASSLNLWDSLIFLLNNAAIFEKSLTQQAISGWKVRANRSGNQPDARQKRELLVLLDHCSDDLFRGKDYLQKLLSS
ncbi:HEAT repeat domain-containing protein [Erwiniaceae bacterium BAC15a-03b]|uniref:HEAT repeat domain-containing protein n=1 Tax=Winslowiella arboricola TaxID=2978220 RepID=A0A9J6PI98_9GAMM|nr:HEAT repeat domain-containing protein [Winslowiella arboricola]MCU5771617.1 HEAT repeat domain-containing protein [Winslowiella arboricola]MCU5776430.1 HEAT repeat domain-containing protein [Winslowiella arboricola]